jgi:hypothetical protein
VLWFQRHSAWAWLMALVVGIVVVAALRLSSDRSAGPLPVSAFESGDGEPGDLAAVAQRMQLLQAQVGNLREQISTLQAGIDERRQRIATLDETLFDDTFNDVPEFLQEDNRLRALQKTIREAAQSSDTAVEGEPRLSTAATVARERLRGKLELTRDQLTQEAAHLEAQADTLKRRLRLQSDEVEHLQQLMCQKLHDPPAAPPDPAP